MSLEERLEALPIEVHVGYAEKLAFALELNLAKQSHESERDSLISVHKTQLEMIQFELSRTKLDLNCAVTKFNKLRQTPLGYRSQVRSHRDLSSLSQSGGHAKVEKRLARQLLGAETARRVHERNLAEGRSA